MLLYSDVETIISYFIAFQKEKKKIWIIAVIHVKLWQAATAAAKVLLFDDGRC